MAIANSDGSIILSTKVDTSGINKGMSQMQGKATNLSKAFSKLGAAIASAFAIQKIIQFSNEAGRLATQTEASVQRLVDIYGSASDAVGDFIDENARALGMSKSAAASFSSVYGNLFSVWADQATNAELTNRYLNMTAVVASKTGRTVEDVQERIRSGLLGNTEAIEDLGIFVNVKTIEMTDAFQRMANGRSWEQLDAYTQQQIRSMAILEQATAKYGDEVADTSATIRNRYKAAYEDFKNSWGNIVNIVLIPVLETLTKIFDLATKGLNAITGRTGQILENVVIQENSSQNTAKNIDQQAENQKNLNKEMKKTLAGFDDLQILSGGISENIENVGETSVPDDFGIQGMISPVSPVSPVGSASSDEYKIPAILDEIYQNAKNIYDLFMQGFWDGFKNADFSDIKESISGIKDSLINIFTSQEIKTAAKGFASSFVFALGQVVGSVASIGKTIASNLFGGFNQYLQKNSDFIKEKIANIFDASAGIVASVGNLWSAFANVFSVFADENGTSLTANIIEIFSNGFLNILDLAYNFGSDVMEMITNPIVENQENLKSTLNGILGFFNDILEPIKEVFNSVGQKINEVYKNEISPFFDAITEGLSEIVNKITDVWNKHIQPVLDNFSKKFNVVVNEHVSPALEGVVQLIGNIADTLEWAWVNYFKPFFLWLVEKIGRRLAQIIEEIGCLFNSIVPVVCDMVKGVTDSLNLLLDFMTGDFKGTWKDVGESLKEIWRRPINGIIKFFEDFINRTIGSFESMINWIIIAMNKLSLNIPDWLGGGTFGFNISPVTFGRVSIPRLAQGAVIPPNREFLAVLGDQKRGTNVEAPLSTIQEAVAVVMEDVVQSNVAGNEAVVSVLKTILEAIQLIDTSDEKYANAVDSYQRKMAILRGV